MIIKIVNKNIYINYKQKSSSNSHPHFSLSQVVFDHRRQQHNTTLTKQKNQSIAIALSMNNKQQQYTTSNGQMGSHNIHAGQHGSTANQHMSSAAQKRIARADYDKFSPIRQIGAQIGTDYNSLPPGVNLGITNHNVKSGIPSGPVYLGVSDEKGPAVYLSHVLDIDSADNLSSSHINHSTLSPQRLHSIREEVGGGTGVAAARMRILESQPGGQILGEPLWSAHNLDSQKRPRGGFTRPFTNSPFPYMQKRSAKTKFQQQQISPGPLPSTAATSSNNQQLSIINELAPGTAVGIGAGQGLLLNSAGGNGAILCAVGGRLSGLNNPLFAQQLLHGEDNSGFQFNANNVTNLQQNLKQNIAGSVINGAGVPLSQSSSIRNGAFNFGYHINSDGGMMAGGHYDREHIMSGGGPSDNSSFYQFNDRSAGFGENEDTIQRFASIGTSNLLPLGKIETAPQSIERRNSQHLNNINRAKATIEVNSKQPHVSSGAAQSVHLRKIINKDSNSVANSPTKESQKAMAANISGNNQNYYVINSHKGKKRKLLTEPQSPSESNTDCHSNIHQQQFAFTHQNLENQLHSLNVGNMSHNNSRDVPIRLSGNKAASQKNGAPGNGGNINQAHYNSVQVGSNVKVKTNIKKKSIDAVTSGARLNHHFINHNGEETSNHYHSVQKYGAHYNPLAERNNSSFENHTQDDNRGRLLSEERQASSFLPRLDANQRQTNSQVMYRDLDENNKSQLRERVDMSMRSPSNNWVNDSLSKISNSKKSVSSDRKVPLPSQNQSQAQTIAHTNNNSSSDFNKIFKPQIKNSNVKGTRHQKQATSSVVQGLTPAGALTGLNGIHVLTHQHSMSGSSNNLGLGGLASNAILEGNQFFKELSNQGEQSGHLKGIGKIQPFNTEFKLNEQVIRGKLQANQQSNRNTQVQIKNINNAAMQDSMGSQSKPPQKVFDQKLMINVTRGSNLQLIPLTEVNSPNNLGSPNNNGSMIQMLHQQNTEMLFLQQQRSQGFQQINQNGQQLSQQNNRLKLQSQEQNSQFLSSFERNVDPGAAAAIVQRGAGGLSSLSQEFQNVAMQSPGGVSQVSNQQMHSNYLQGLNLQQINQQTEIIRPFNYRNFSVSQTSSKESNTGMISNITPSKSIGDGPGTASQDYSVTPNSQFMYDEDMNQRGEMTGLRTQHSSGQVNLQNNLIENVAGRQLFSPPQQQSQIYNYAGQSMMAEGTGKKQKVYFDQSSSNINFIDAEQFQIMALNNTISADPHSLNSAGGMLSLRSQNSQQYSVNHQIKTVASKQIPKCFRMSKQQLQQITNKVASRGSVYNGGIIPFGPPQSGLGKQQPLTEGGMMISSGLNSSAGTPQGGVPQNDQQQNIQQSPSHFNQKQGGLISASGTPTSIADNRISFNDYSQFQKQLPQQQPTAPLQALIAAANLSPAKNKLQAQQNATMMHPGQDHSNIFSSGGNRLRDSEHDHEKTSSIMDRDISERSVDEERERMTPAFNNRIRIDIMRNTQNASAKNGETSNAFKQVVAPTMHGAAVVLNESHLQAMNHTLNSKGINLTEAIASAKID